MKYGPNTQPLDFSPKTENYLLVLVLKKIIFCLFFGQNIGLKLSGCHVFWMIAIDVVSALSDLI